MDEDRAALPSLRDAVEYEMTADGLVMVVDQIITDSQVVDGKVVPRVVAPPPAEAAAPRRRPVEPAAAAPLAASTPSPKE